MRYSTRYTVTIKNNINEVRTYTTLAMDRDEAITKASRTYKFTTDNLPIVEIEVKAEI